MILVALMLALALLAVMAGLGIAWLLARTISAESCKRHAPRDINNDLMGAGRA